MRLTRIVVVTALAASTTAAVVPVAAATPAPVSVFSMSRSLDGAATNTGPVVFDVANAGLTADVSTTPGAITFSASPSTGVHDGGQFTATVTPPTGGALTPGPYTTDDAATASAPGLFVTSSGTSCTTRTGSLHITQADPGTIGQPITAFAATYSFLCTSGPSVTGTLSWQSTRTDVSAMDATPAAWDFGWQRTGTDGTAKTFVFVNRGSADFTLAKAPEILAGTGGFSVRTSGSTCLTATVSPTGKCALVVVPHPTASISSTYPGTQRILRLTPTTGQTIDLPIREEGQPYATTYVQPGPGRITFHWGSVQPNPIGSSLAGYAVYRGTIGQAPKYFRSTSYYSTSLTDTTITTGQPYYYQVRPVFQFQEGAGDLSPVVAATAWPAYSAGMYHRFSTSQRILTSRTILAGHPYALQITGAPGVPATGVSAVALQVTAAKPTSTTAVTVYPYGTARPAAPDLTVTRGSARTNFVLARIGAGGKIVLSTSSGSTPVSVDVFGFYSASGLSTAYGQGGAMHTYLTQGTIMDTKAYGIGPLPKGYYLDMPVDFAPVDTPHVTSLLVEITAYGSSGGGTLTAYPTNHAAPPTSAMTYAGGRVTTNVALVAAGQFVDSNSGTQFPSVSVLNRGSTAVHLIVTILGFVDDNTFSYGERYTPGSATHLLSTTVYSGSTRTIAPSTSVAGSYTTALNAKVLVGSPAVTTAEALWPGNVPNVSAPSRPQVRANGHETTIGSTPAPLGNGNLLDIRNTAGQARLDLWSFGRFDYYPQPTSPKSFLAVAAPRPARLAPAAAPVAVRPAHLG